jgi:hypothetical protein
MTDAELALCKLAADNFPEYAWAKPHIEAEIARRPPYVREPWAAFAQRVVEMIEHGAPEEQVYAYLDRHRHKRERAAA